ncbi:MAG: LOG family protein [Oligoflexia bacterium]|nr:LOG family protein [Oligoflexia bacterium]
MPRKNKNSSRPGTVPAKARQGKRGLLRRHLDERLRALHQRAMLLERELVALDDNRFYRTCIFGSARIKPETPAYRDVYELARMLSWEGIDILTGGGPGLMEAANRGAKLGQEEKNTRSLSFGISIQLDTEPEPNKHIDINRHHHRFSSRLDDFMRLSHSVICTPGGVGTLLEFFFSWQLVQRKHMSERPIVLLGGEFWVDLIAWMKKKPLRDGLMDAPDFKYIHIVKTPEQAFEIISEHCREFHLANRKRSTKKKLPAR